MDGEDTTLNFVDVWRNKYIMFYNHIFDIFKMLAYRYYINLPMVEATVVEDWYNSDGNKRELL